MAMAYPTYVCCWMMQCSYTSNALIVKSLAFQLGGLSCLSYRQAKIPIFKVTDLFEIVTATEGQVQFLVVKVIIFAHLARLCFNLVVLNELGYRDLLRYRRLHFLVTSSSYPARVVDISRTWRRIRLDLILPKLVFYPTLTAYE